MSIELKQAAQQALEALTFIRRQLKSWDRGDSVIDALRTALARHPATPESVQADSSEHLRVIASLGAALRRLSFAAQTTGGTDGPDAELQSAIGQAEQALSLGGIWQAMSATTEPVYQIRKAFTQDAEWAWRDATEALFHMHPKEHRRILYTRPAPSAPATPEPGAWSERELLRHAQAAVVMPMIGPLLDAWENSDREVMSQEPELSKQLKNINSAMEDADTRPAPSVPNLIEKAISSGCFGVLPVKATIPMCKAGWGASGGELTFQQIGHIYEEMYKARPLPDDAIYAAPSVPDDVVRDAERGRFLVGWLKRYGLLQAEFGQMGVGEKPENWWLLHAPWGIDKTRPFFGHGKTPEQAIDAAKDAT